MLSCTYFRTYVHAYLVVVNVVLGRNGTFLVSKLERRNLVSRPYSQIRRWTSFRLFYWTAAFETGPACPRNAFPKRAFFSRFDHSKSAFNSFANYSEMISAYFFRKVQRFCATSILSIRIQNRLSRQPQLIDREGTHVSWEIMGPQLVSSHI